MDLVAPIPTGGFILALRRSSPAVSLITESRRVVVSGLPAAWKGTFRYGSCFRYSEGSGMGAPSAQCPKRYRF